MKAVLSSKFIGIICCRLISFKNTFGTPFGTPFATPFATPFRALLGTPFRALLGTLFEQLFVRSLSTCFSIFGIHS